MRKDFIRLVQRFRLGRLFRNSMGQQKCLDIMSEITRFYTGAKKTRTQTYKTTIIVFNRFRTQCRSGGVVRNAYDCTGERTYAQSGRAAVGGAYFKYVIANIRARTQHANVSPNSRCL